MSAAEFLIWEIKWSPYLWTAFSLLLLGVSYRLWDRTRLNRRKLSIIAEGGEDGPVRKILRQFERLVLVSSGVALSLILLGFLSIAKVANVWVSIFTITILILLPLALLWIVYKAFRLYEGPPE